MLLQSYRNTKQGGFTLIELSIVMVIIGLIVGGILVGQDLIQAAAVRAQITQLEKFNRAVNTFRVKYNALPGDMDSSTATTFGFSTARGGSGQGDSNGVLDGGATDTIAHKLQQGQGETGMFWVDLSSPVAGGLIDGSFITATEAGTTTASSTQIANYMPAAKVGANAYIYVYEYNQTASVGIAGLSGNYFGLATVNSITSGQMSTSSSTLTVRQAYNMDAKIDDGLPFSGTVISYYISGANLINSPYTSGACNSSTCIDFTTTPMSYCVGYRSGSSTTCALSFKFQ